jgi:hypothetical protein
MVPKEHKVLKVKKDLVVPNHVVPLLHPLQNVVVVDGVKTYQVMRDIRQPDGLFSL